MFSLNRFSTLAVGLVTAAAATGASADSVADNFAIYDNPTGLDFVGAPAGFNTFGSTEDRGQISLGIVAGNVENFSVSQIFLESGLSDFIGGNLELSYEAETDEPSYTVDDTPGVPAPVNPEWNGTFLSLSAQQPLNETADRLFIGFDLLGDLEAFEDVVGTEGFRLAASLNGPEGTISSITGPFEAIDGGGNGNGNGGPAVIPTPSAVLGGLALLGLAAARRRNASA